MKGKNASVERILPVGSVSRLAVAAFFCVAGILLHGFGLAQSSNSNSAEAVLRGVVTSQNEGEMEGVLVTAKRVGGSVAVTVVTDSQGHYAFPRNRLRSGPYRMQIRAVGYDLEDPGTIEVRAGSTENLNLKLRNTRDLASEIHPRCRCLEIGPASNAQLRFLQLLAEPVQVALGSSTQSWGCGTGRVLEFGQPQRRSRAEV
jgi:hypothetical protein